MLFTVKDLSFSYGTKKVIENISFEVFKGDYLCIIGENGAGKTTLLKCLLGLLKPETGQVMFNGVKQNEIGYLPQQTSIQKDFPASVNEIVLSACCANNKIFSFYTAKDKKLVDYILEKMGIFIYKNTSYRDLSGGLQQRVLIARALISAKKILFLDEPCNNLDKETIANMYQLISKLNTVDNITIIMINHDIDNAIKYSSKILQISKNLLFFGNKSDYLLTKHYYRLVDDDNF